MTPSIVMQGTPWIAEHAGQPKIGNFDESLLSVRHHEDVRGLKVAVDNPVLVEVIEAVDELPHEGLDLKGGRRRRGMRERERDFETENEKENL